MEKTIVYFDMDDTLCDYSGSISMSRKKCPNQWFPQAQLDFFRRLKPIDEMIEFMKIMNLSDSFEPWIATAPSVQNPLCYMEKRIWVEENVGYWAAERLIIIPDKSKLISGILIDDQRTGRGQDKFSGKLIVPSDYNNLDEIMQECIAYRRNINFLNE